MHVIGKKIKSTGGCKKPFLVNYKIVFYTFKNRGMVNEYNIFCLKHRGGIFFSLFFSGKNNNI